MKIRKGGRKTVFFEKNKINFKKSIDIGDTVWHYIIVAREWQERR